MGRIIRLGANGHQKVQALLPWYVNGTLQDGERATVDAHLATCEACRAELAAERRLRAEIAAIPEDVERGWASLQTRMGDEREEIRTAVSRRSFWHRSVSLGGALAAQAAAIVVLIGAGVLALPRLTAPSAPYHALSSPRATTHADLIVMFRPDATEAELRDALVAAHARVVDGPTASHAYVLSLRDTDRATALARLRADAHVQLAEPLDPATDQP